MSEPPLRGKVAIVTGAGSTIGLGHAMTLALLRAGARVTLMDVDAQSLEQSTTDAAEVAGSRSALPVVGDVSKPDDVQRAVERTLAEFGGLHILVNNAGINPRVDAGPSNLIFDNIPPDVWLKTFEVNVSGAFLMARAVAGHMVGQGWGRIIGITTSMDTMLRVAPYGPSKAAHEALMAVMAHELQGTGVTANVLIPGGATNTMMTQAERDRGKLLAPEVMQASAVWLASDASDGFTGCRLTAQLWDEELPLDERLAKASAPVGWPQLGRNAES
jgi:NAD(P)-dependent dehydrogenase (short-subunit alcohol dehydrogenase family)